jgi:hypothetical protein
MDEEPKPISNDDERLEQLRRWFEALGDCV